MYVLKSSENPKYPPLSGGLLGMYNKMKAFAHDNRGEWVCIYDESVDGPRMWDDWFLLANSYLRFEQRWYNWQPYKIEFEYRPSRRVLVKYR